MPERILLVGALAVETAPLIRKTGATRIIAPRTLIGRWAGRDVAVTTCGVGPAAAFRTTSAALQIFPADRVLSIGTAGALVDGLSRGDVRTADRVLAGGSPLAELEPLPGLLATTIASVAKPVWRADRRSLLAEAGAELVEMELAAVFQAAEGRPVHAIKVVSDAAGRGNDAPRPTTGLKKAALVARFHARTVGIAARQLAPAVLGALERLG